MLPGPAKPPGLSKGGGATNDQTASAMIDSVGGAAKWQATSCSGAFSSSAGSFVAQMSWAFQQRVRKRQPDGGSTGEGTSPTRRIRFFGGTPRTTAMSGTAESSACVYGCCGFS